jgi:hypothetical protein
LAKLRTPNRSFRIPIGTLSRDRSPSSRISPRAVEANSVGASSQASGEVLTSKIRIGRPPEWRSTAQTSPSTPSDERPTASIIGSISKETKCRLTLARNTA